MPDYGNNSVFSQTDANNNTGTNPGFPEGMAPSRVNDAARALQGTAKRDWDYTHYTVISTNTAAAQVLTYAVAPELNTNQMFGFIAGFAPTGVTTLNINALGAKTIKKLVAGGLTDIANNDWAANDQIMVRYDGTNMVLVSVGKLSTAFLPNVVDLGCTPTMAADQTALLNAAFASVLGKEIYVPTGAYRCDGALTISTGTRVRMAKGAVFYRNSAFSASTVPVLYLLDAYSECTGGTIKTDNGSPNGAVVLGHMNNTDNRNAWYWRFCDMDVQGNNIAGSIGWAIVSGQVTFPSNANYFGCVDRVTSKAFDIGCKLFEDANAHNISNTQFWQCRTANISLRGAYANNFVNMFFTGGFANGCIGIQLLNKTVGPFTDSTFNTFVGFTDETGGAADLAFTIDTGCFENTLIGHSNVAGGWTINNTQNTISVGNLSINKGQYSTATAIPFGVATTISDLAVLNTGAMGASLVMASIYNTAQNNFNRSDLLLISGRNNAFAASTVTVVSSAFTNTGGNGEPIAAAYALSFAGGIVNPVLTVNITSVGSVAGTTFIAKVKTISP